MKQLTIRWQPVAVWCLFLTATILSSSVTDAQNTREDQVQKMYISYYGRPADPGGLRYWVGRLDAANGDLAAIIEAFATSPEYTNRFGGLGDEALVNNTYRQLFGRDADPAGLSFYTSELNAGRMTRATIGLNIADGAVAGPDAQVLANRDAVADEFTEAIEAHDIAYRAEQIEFASTLLANVDTTEASRESALEQVVAMSQRIFTLNELDFELDTLIGRTVWVIGYYGTANFSTDGYGYLVDNPARLYVDEDFPHHTMAAVGGQLPPEEWAFDEILVRAEVASYNAMTGAQLERDVALLTVEESIRIGDPPAAETWEDLYATEDASAASSEGNLILEASELPPLLSVREEIAGVQASDCDRALIISGGGSERANHARYRVNVASKTKRLRELGFTEEQIEVFYDDGNTVTGTGDNSGTSVSTGKATKADILAHLQTLAEEMPPSCTLTLFVTDHGAGYRKEQGYRGQRPASPESAEADNGVSYPEDEFFIDARKKTYIESRSFRTSGGTLLIVDLNTDGSISVFRRTSESSYTRVARNIEADGGIFSEAAMGVDINGDGDVKTDFGLTAETLKSWIETYGERKYRTNTWDTDRDGETTEGESKADLRLRFDSTAGKFVVERWNGSGWTVIGSDSNGDYKIDEDDGGVDWNMDGDKEDTVAFHEGIVLWDREMLWDDEFAAALKPLADKGVHIMVEMNACFSGGFAPNVEGIVENMIAGSSENDKHRSRVIREEGAVRIEATDQQAFLAHLTGIDTDSWNRAAEAAIAADNAVADAGSGRRNTYVREGTPYYETDSVFEEDEEGRLRVQVIRPQGIEKDIHDHEFIYGLQNPRWSSVSFSLGDLPQGVVDQDAPGGIRFFRASDPLKNGVVWTLKPFLSAPATSEIEKVRVEFTDIDHNRLGYTWATRGEIQEPEPIADILFGESTVCVSHDGPPSGQEGFSSLSLLLAVIVNAAASNPEVYLQITGPNLFQKLIVAQVVNNYLSIASGILSYGLYQFTVQQVQDTQSSSSLTFEPFNQTFEVTAEETNEGACSTPG